MLNIRGSLNYATICLQLGAAEATLILEGYLKRNENYDDEDFKNLIKITSEKYFTDHNIF
jgi:hypothetical protein